MTLSGGLSTENRKILKNKTTSWNGPGVLYFTVAIKKTFSVAFVLLCILILIHVYIIKKRLKMLKTKQKTPHEAGRFWILSCSYGQVSAAFSKTTMNDRFLNVFENCQENVTLWCQTTRFQNWCQYIGLAVKPINLNSVKIKVKTKPKKPSQISSIFFETNQTNIGKIMRGRMVGWVFPTQLTLKSPSS